MPNSSQPGVDPAYPQKAVVLVSKIISPTWALLTLEVPFTFGAENPIPDSKTWLPAFAARLRKKKKGREQAKAQSHIVSLSWLLVK